MSIAFNGSGIELITDDASTVTDACWAFERGTTGRVVRFVRGAKMPDAQGVFDQFGAALQFPFYFGENWDAFSECIQDLSWLPAAHYVLVVLGAEALLKTDEDAFAALMAILGDCCKNWPVGFDLDQPWARQPANFQVLLQTNYQQIERLKQRLVDSAAVLVRR